jgi:hypothetical protein
MVCLSTPKILTMPHLLFNNYEDANVQTISFANTRLDRCLPMGENMVKYAKKIFIM